MAEDLAAQIVASARTADGIFERQRRFIVFEVGSQIKNEGSFITTRVKRADNRGQPTIALENTQDALQNLLNDGWRIEQSSPVSSIIKVRKQHPDNRLRDIEELHKIESSVLVLSKPIHLCS